MTLAKFSLPLLGAVAIACAAGLLMSQSGQISPAAQISVPRQCVVNICQLAPPPRSSRWGSCTTAP